jgi:hypothetical protein
MMEAAIAAIGVGAWETGAGITQTFDEETEVYTVRPFIWKKAGMKPFDGCLCIGCLEKRLGRRLKPKDFLRNDPFGDVPGTPRLMSRRRSAKSSTKTVYRWAGISSPEGASHPRGAERSA